MYTNETKIFYDNLCNINNSLNLSNKKILIISDSNVAPLYMQELAKALKGNSVFTIVFNSGEQSKSFNCLKEILENLHLHSFSRSDCIVALGGGVIGDLSSLAANLYMRGIEFYNIPTSLLAMVDSAVGGKNAINFCGIKNLIGSFYFPNAVFIDKSLLSTLDAEHYKSGLCEVLKMLLLFSKEDLAFLNSNTNIQYLIKRCIDLKQIIVKQDSHDSNKRALLNFGHSMGHAIELKLNLQHGIAVALGMEWAIAIGTSLGISKEELLCQYQDLARKLDIPLIKDFNIPISCLDIMQSDKKSQNNSINLILLKDMAEPIMYNIDFKSLRTIHKKLFKE